MTDPVVSELREEISAVDRALLAGLNRRLEIVGRLHDHKRAEGLPLRDPGREESLLRELEAANGGPLSPSGVVEFFRHVLELTLKELHGE